MFGVGSEDLIGMDVVLFVSAFQVVDFVLVVKVQQVQSIQQQVLL